jgi:hypothetical protein
MHEQTKAVDESMGFQYCSDKTSFTLIEDPERLRRPP